MAFLLCALLFLLETVRGERLALHLKNGDRVTGKFVSESTNSITLASPVFGRIEVPLAEILKRESLPEPTNAPAASSTNSTSATAPPPPAPAGTTNNAPAPALKKKEPKPPLTPANPEATPIASTPDYWKHDVRFGLNLRYAEKDSQEFLIIGKSTYGKQPFRHIFDLNFKYGHTEGVLSENSLSGSEKTEYQLSPKSYLFNIFGGGYDEIRKIDVQYELGPGIGTELLKLTNFVWKSEAGLNFEQQYRSDDTTQTSYSVRLAEIFAWRVWDKLTADAKIEFYPNLASLGQYRLRFESNLRYPVSSRISLNLDLVDIYDTQPASQVDPNDMQIRSTIGVTF